jgi:hypothetical protein
MCMCVHEYVCVVRKCLDVCMHPNAPMYVYVLRCITYVIESESTFCYPPVCAQVHIHILCHVFMSHVCTSHVYVTCLYVTCLCRISLCHVFMSRVYVTFVYVTCLCHMSVCDMSYVTCIYVTSLYVTCICVTCLYVTCIYVTHVFIYSMHSCTHLCSNFVSIFSRRKRKDFDADVCESAFNASVYRYVCVCMYVCMNV